MSFGDPNNPYGQPQGQPQQPGYGYPQQGQPQQPGYGYPAAPPPAPAYGGGYPGVPMEMPGGVKAARVMLFILGGLQAAGAVFVLIASAWIMEMISGSPEISSADADKAAAVGMGAMIFAAILIAGFALWAILTAAKFSKGRGGIRISAIIYASVITLFSLFSLLTGNIFALVSLVLGILIIVFCAKSDGGAWFNRPRY
ncbi:hypothetical protein AB0A69_15970 [Streptomyces sp. NPDC045431]|uniref:hypothetical protein n=1 Tax=Streptomyces sp. NPDC045431 TaxID=3155613 RepID=UPI0033F1AC37